MKKSLFLITITFSIFFANAQQEASNWHFGSGAGLTFDLFNDTVTPINSAVSTNEGCSSISAANDGTVLFYTDGRSVWDANNNIMPNANYNSGNGLLGDPSSTSSGLIIPKPNDPNLYYIFTVDEPHHNNAWAYPTQGPQDINGNPINFYQESFGNVPASSNVDDGFNNGLTYSLIDLSLNGGNGDVVVSEKNVPLITYDVADFIETSYKCSEKITAVAANDCESIWVITHFRDKFYSFKIDNSGVNPTPQVSEIPGDIDIVTNGYRRNAIGYIKASPDGSKIAICHNQNANVPGNQVEPFTSGSFWVYDFDNATGIVSNGVELLTNISTYGTEFSSDSKKVYVSGSNAINQFDLDNNNQQTTVFTTIGGFLGAMQLAPNGKIYVINTFNNNFLDVIENPNEVGFACNYNQNGQALATGTSANLGLPPFISSFFVESIDIIRDDDSESTLLSLCNGDTYTLLADILPNATYTWTLDGNTIDDGNANPFDFEIAPNQGGLYEVLIQQNNGDCNTFEGQALVTFYDIPVANNIIDVNECEGTTDGVASFNFTNKNPEALGAQDPSEFSVAYFANIEDANNNENELTFPFQNTTNPQEIFVRVENSNNSNCYNINSFNIIVFDTPTVSRLDNILLCDTEDDTTDGIVTTVLSNLNSDILGANQLAADFTITYYSSQDDADNVANELPDNYQNVPFSDEVFVRMVNNNNTDCVTIDSFTLTINLTPEVNDISLFQCDEDGIPDRRTVFNILEKEDDITGGNPDFNVSYYLDMSDAMTETNPIDASNYTNISNPQIIIARTTDTISTCFSFSEVNLAVSATTANDAYIGICDTDDAEDGFMDFDLSLADAQVLDELPNGLNLAYYETLEDALLEINPLANNYRNTTAFTQILYVRVENQNNCYGINEVELEVLTLPNVETFFETLYCLNDFPEPIVINGGVINDIPNNYYYDWSTGETTIEIEVNEPNTYTVTVSNVAGCSKERTVVVNASNIATIQGIEVTDASENNTITVLLAPGEGDYEFALNDPNSVYQDSNIFENVRPGIYTVFVRDKNGCGIIEKMVSVVGFPKFFTPNGDGQNDFWQVKGISSQFQQDTIIYIFDKYGKLINEISPTGSGWDGTYNGNPMPSSDYWFSVTLEDGRRFSSHFALKR
ncbi:MAG: T9SS type B sorting domain-containing protein [Winogradskyella sp.]|uniref:T9SS type B sorting domain-containing protein n=1 Tax=Winogradskyella sp. TaxID=1883156 RepID=UPI0017ABCF92|nr:T9SS type B sorting domain-containing protein [Winogradskyella sp.]MBT8245551.1 T9SS type B sorting domain-containing protein [Winogradskyella sp.]NNK23936.1 T9SS type B sorting domain-containing protein [Winogradskyella sp.]